MWNLLIHEIKCFAFIKQQKQHDLKSVINYKSSSSITFAKKLKINYVVNTKQSDIPAGDSGIVGSLGVVGAVKIF